MKRVKLMITSVALVALVGSTLAFKAYKFGSIRIYQKPTPTAACTLLTQKFVEVGTLVFTNATTVADAPVLPETTTDACNSQITLGAE